MSKINLLDEHDLAVYAKLDKIFKGQELETVFRVLTIYMVTSLENLFNGNREHIVNTLDLYCKGMRDVANSGIKH